MKFLEEREGSSTSISKTFWGKWNLATGGVAVARQPRSSSYSRFSENILVSLYSIHFSSLKYLFHKWTLRVTYLNSKLKGICFNFRAHLFHRLSRGPCGSLWSETISNCFIPVFPVTSPSCYLDVHFRCSKYFLTY